MTAVCCACLKQLDHSRIPTDLLFRPHFCSMKCARRSGVDMALDGRTTAAPAYIEEETYALHW